MNARSLRTRSAVAARAKDYLGTRWRHMGRSTKGLDCVGLVIVLAKEFGFCPPDLEIPPYNREPDGSLMGYFADNMDRAYEPRLATVCVFSYMGSPYHAGIVVDERRRVIVHAFAHEKRVAMGALDSVRDTRKLVAMWDYRGIEDG